MEVKGRSVHGRNAYLTIVQDDGTLAKIPAWMTDEDARTASIVEAPALSVNALSEVRALVDWLLGSGDQESFPASGDEYDDAHPPATASIRYLPQSCSDTPRASLTPSEADRGTVAGSGAKRGAARRADQQDGGER